MLEKLERWLLRFNFARCRKCERKESLGRTYFPMRSAAAGCGLLAVNGRRNGKASLSESLSLFCSCFGNDLRRGAH
jgi:hypothetical protein